MFKHSSEYFFRAKIESYRGKKRNRLLRYIRENGWTSNMCYKAKNTCSFPKKARSSYGTMSINMVRLWQEGKVEGVSLGKNKWEYIAVE